MAGRIAYYGNIVTDGLVLNLDAAKRDSYPGSGTAWRDISGFGNNGTLINGPTFNPNNFGSIVFDGVNDYVASSNILNIGNRFTVNAWVQVTTLSTSISARRIIISNDYPYLGGRGFLFSASGNNGTDFWISLGNDQKLAVSSTGLITTNTAYMLSARVNATDLIKLYRNGIEIPSYAVQNDGNVSLSYNTGYILGSRNVVADYFAGNIYNVQVYNRALSDAEILQNFNATKGRYGL
jgi:hypothetical protein